MNTGPNEYSGNDPHYVSDERLEEMIEEGSIAAQEEKDHRDHDWDEMMRDGK